MWVVMEGLRAISIASQAGFPSPSAIHTNFPRCSSTQERSHKEGGALPPPSANVPCYSLAVEITLKIPDELARQVAPDGQDPARVALEALALEGYRSELLSESAVRQMLGFETRMKVHAFLKAHGVYLHYDISDLERNQATSRHFREKQQEPRLR
jgi:hypothetical protein